MKYKLIAVLALTISLILTGCGKQAADVPKTGVPVLVSKSPFTVCTWPGTLSEEGNAVTIETTSEQSELFDLNKNYKLVVYSEKLDDFFENATVDEVSEKTDGAGCIVKIDLGSDQRAEADDSIEVLLRKNNTISVSLAFIQEDENGKYVWKVENDLSASVNQSVTGERKSVKLENPKKVYIETGLSNKNKVEVTTGLSTGDIIARPEG